MSFTKWWTSSLKGHVVVLQLFLSVPLFVMFAIRTYNDGALTLHWVLLALFVTSLGGFVAAILDWYVITIPARNKYGSRS